MLQNAAMCLSVSDPVLAHKPNTEWCRNFRFGGITFALMCNWHLFHAK